MQLNIAKLLNDLLDGVVLYTYSYLRSIWIVARYPIRGPRYLAYQNFRKPDRTVSPSAFLFINLIIAFYFMEFASSLAFGFEKSNFTVAEFNETVERIRAKQVDFLPTIVRTIIAFVTVYAILDVTTSEFVRHPPRRAFVRNSWLFSFGLQPLAIIPAFISAAYYIYSKHHWMLIFNSTLALLTLMASLSVVFSVDVLKNYFAKQHTLLYRKSLVGSLSAIFLVALYFEAVLLFNLPLFEPPMRPVIGDLRCHIVDSGHVIVEAFIENPTSRRILIPLQTGARVFNVSSDHNLIEGGTLESSAGERAPFLALDPAATGWVRLTAEMVSSSQAPKTCNLSLQSGLDSDLGSYHGRKDADWSR
jgi:hypothetical protein